MSRPDFEFKRCETEAEWQDAYSIRCQGESNAYQLTAVFVEEQVGS